MLHIKKQTTNTWSLLLWTLYTVLLFARHIFTKVFERGFVELKAMQVLAGDGDTFLHLSIFPVGIIDYVSSLRLEIGVNKPSHNEVTAILETGEVLSAEPDEVSQNRTRHALVRAFIQASAHNGWTRGCPLMRWGQPITLKHHDAMGVDGAKYTRPFHDRMAFLRSEVWIWWTMC